jgi:preprotein translocase subunit SecA
MDSKELKAELKKANNEFTSCISEEFLTKFLAGEQVNVENFCIEERKRMLDLDQQIFGKLPF